MNTQKPALHVFHLLHNVDVQVYQVWNACMYTHSYSIQSFQSEIPKSVVWWAVCGWWQDIKDPKPPDAEEELRKTGRVHGICHAICFKYDVAKEP